MNSSVKAKLFLLCLVAIAWSCKTEGDKLTDKLTGHWISTGYFNKEPFFTIDFESYQGKNIDDNVDSTFYYLVFEKNSLSFIGGLKNALVTGDKGDELDFS